MPQDYRVPASYVEEVPIPNVGINAATAATLFVGALAAGPSDLQQVESWNDYVALYGAPSGFEGVPVPSGGSKKSFLPFEVYSYFRNGGRPALIQRAVGAGAGTPATATINGYGTGLAASPSTVSNVARTGSTATLTTAAAHGKVAGDIINITGVTNASNAFNKTKAVVLTAPTTTTLTYTTTGSGTVTSAAATGTTPRLGTPDTVPVLTLTARSATSAANFVDGLVDQGLVVEITLTGNTTVNGKPLFNLVIYKDNQAVENYKNLTLDADDGTRSPSSALSNSASVEVTFSDDSLTPFTTTYPDGAFAGGVDPDVPDEAAIRSSAIAAVGEINDPVIVVVAGYVDSFSADDRDSFVSTTFTASDFGSREDVFIINDNAPQKDADITSAAYATQVDASDSLSPNSSDSYLASFTPWITVSDPRTNIDRITIPPGGSVAGVISRTDAQFGVFRTPAGVIANVVDALDVDTIFTQSQLGTLNDHHVNVIRQVPGQGICIMGGRTRKAYGIDKYIAARRTLIFVKESLRRSTQYAVFENNDQRLWSNLIVTAESILRPLWESGGLKGASAQEAYFIQCDSTLNTPDVVAAGEVHMNIGVALESPAEFIIIRVAQSQGGATTTEIAA